MSPGKINPAALEYVKEHRAELLAMIAGVNDKKHGYDRADEMTKAVYDYLLECVAELRNSEMDVLIGIIAFQMITDMQLSGVLDQVRQRQAQA